MYSTKSSKICPFCRGKVKRLSESYKCENCGAIIKIEALDTRAYNMHFFNGRR
jgi:tRNA(Ile2) C34 agmatinyltransferase TiaS